MSATSCGCAKRHSPKDTGDRRRRRSGLHTTRSFGDVSTKLSTFSVIHLIAAFSSTFPSLVDGAYELFMCVRVCDPCVRACESDTIPKTGRASKERERGRE